jgi:type VI protein secretion system component Hcp
MDKAVISLIKPGGADLVYMKFTLTAVVITSVKLEGNPEGDSVYPIEEIGLSYGGIEWEYDKMDEKGKSKGKVATKYSVLTGKTG